MRACTLIGFALVVFLTSLGAADAAGRQVRISPDLDLYYEDAGSGRPVIFITGWTGTHDFFDGQIAHFSKKYRVLAYDPRSQGRSTKTLESNTYTQHGHDLRAFMQALQLKDVVVVAWSWGCHDVYAYVRAYGADNVKGFACIDQTPRSIPAQPGDWSELPDLAAVGGFLSGVINDRRALMLEFIPTMMQRKMAAEEIDWALSQTMKTPNYVAAVLGADAAFADYTNEARAIDGKIAVLNFVSDAQAASAKAWLARHAPHSQVVVMGNHMMFREFPDRFNAALERFLDGIR